MPDYATFATNPKSVQLPECYQALTFVAERLTGPEIAAHIAPNKNKGRERP
jgi:hypothetical protein